MSDLSMRLKQRARVLAAGVALSAATLVILPGVAEACDSTSCDGGGSPSGSLTNSFGDQEANLTSEQSNTQEQDSTQVSLANAAVSTPIAVGIGGDATNEDSGANAGNFSEQDQWASNESTQEVDQEQNAGKSYSKDHSKDYSKDYSNDCSKDCSGKQPTNDFGKQEADLSSRQSNSQEQDNKQISGINAAASVPISVGVKGDATNEDSGANAGNFNEQDQRASNKSTQEADQEQNTDRPDSKKEGESNKDHETS